MRAICSPNEKTIGGKQMSNIHVTSEIKTLKKVLLHRPGEELLNLTPDTLGGIII